jgi:hypothetical protein
VQQKQIKNIDRSPHIPPSNTTRKASCKLAFNTIQRIFNHLRKETQGLLGVCLIGIGNWAPATDSIGTRQNGEEPRIGTMITTMTMILLMIA